MSNNNIQRHPFHLVDSSPWPFLVGVTSLAITFSFVMYMQCYSFGFYLFTFSFLTLIILSSFWWRDVVREATYQGHHTKAVQFGDIILMQLSLIYLIPTVVREFHFLFLLI